jgi:hypothetical protein
MPVRRGVSLRAKISRATAETSTSMTKKPLMRLTNICAKKSRRFMPLATSQGMNCE